jgi:enoyl-CoA hydratase
MTDQEPVLTERRGRVLVIALNRPGVKNAINQAVVDAVLAAFERLDADNDLSVAVFTGAGAAFCAGMDLKEFLVKGPPRRFAHMIDGGRPRKPLIAAVEGPALAGGLELALTCDLIVAAKNASLGIPEVRRGLFAAAGGLTRLAQRLPYGVAMEMAVTGEPLSAQRAFGYGLVNRLTENGGAFDAAVALATQIAANAPLAVAASKELIQRSQGLTEQEFFTLQAPFVKPVFTSRDSIEGARAFAEKRWPNWIGS